MKVRAVGRTHMMLILTAEEANALGIPTESGCALILRTRSACFPQPPSPPRRYRVRLLPQICVTDSCSALLDLLERLCAVEGSFPCRLFLVDGRYAVTVTPPCRQFLFLRSLLSEYGVRQPCRRHGLTALLEHGVCLCEDVLSSFRPVFSGRMPPS